MKSMSEISEGRFLGSISTSSIRNLLPRSITGNRKPKSNSYIRSSKSDVENTPPVDPNILVKSVQFTTNKGLPSEGHTVQSDCQNESLTPADPSTKKEIRRLDSHDEQSNTLDPSVKVVVRIKPAIEGRRAARKVSSDTLCIEDRKFTFDSVLDSKSNQEEIFQLVGVPLVEDALAGYNTSILSYGQTGSGKTYTMWGPPSAMVEDPSPYSLQGIVPRVFQMLFEEIERVQGNSDGKHINYQCRCSFLEIYDEQIGDLLDPTQRNLQIKDDPKNGFYVENLTEEYVTSSEDVTQILIKGLSSRKVGVTSINSKSSRSHVVFTFMIESWCKEPSSKCFSSSRTSRITLVDLAGPDRNKLDDVGKQHVKEGKYVKKSLSRLGHLVSALANKDAPGKSEDIPYRESCLTHLLRENLGGNSKLAVICAVSADNRDSGEILSTLRFAQLVKCIKNEPVINEISENDVNDLSDQIRQLKEELIRAKSDVHDSVGITNGYFRGRNVRESLNHLRVSLNRSLILPSIDTFDEEVIADEDDVREICAQLDKLHSSSEEDLRDSVQCSFVSANCEAELMSDDEFSTEELAFEDIETEKPLQEEHHMDDNLSEDIPIDPKTSISVEPALRSSLSISTFRKCPTLLEPTFSESPKIGNNQRKNIMENLDIVNESTKLKSECIRQSLRQSEHIRSSKVFPGQTESLAASLHRGLQIMDQHQRNSASTRSSVSFSFEHLTLKPISEVDKSRTSVQSLEENPPSSLFCPSCQQNFENNPKEVQDNLETSIIAVDEDKAAKDEKEKAINRANELEILCKEQQTKIEHLHCELEQYKHEREREILPLEEVGNVHNLPTDENKILGCCDDVEDHQLEVIEDKCEVKQVQEEYESTYFDVTEKEALLNEIESLKRKLQQQHSHAVASSTNDSTEKLRSSLLSRSFQLRKSVDFRKNTEEQLENERQRWTEMESDWISLTDELRIDLESYRRRAEKAEMELKKEKNCTEELDDALHRSVLGHARFVEHYAELQEKYDDLAAKHRAIMEGIAEVKRATLKAGAKGHGSRFAKSLAAELSVLRVEREREKEFLKKENKSLKLQLRDTAEAVHAAGELLVRLREAEHAASVAEEKSLRMQEEHEKVKKQTEKLKRKHKMEMVTMKQYLAESKLPESALQPLYEQNSDVGHHSMTTEDDQSWREEFGAAYQTHY